MTKKSKLVKNALKTPWLYTFGELSYFRLWLEQRKKRKLAKIQKENTEDS
jgi:hypothetical protein